MIDPGDVRHQSLPLLAECVRTTHPYGIAYLEVCLAGMPGLALCAVDHTHVKEDSSGPGAVFWPTIKHHTKLLLFRMVHVSLS